MKCIALAIVLSVFIPPVALSQVDIDRQVDVELVLAVDVSGSMSFEEMQIQRRGYAEAFQSDEVFNAIESGLLGKVAVTYVEWARYDLKKVIVPWSLIEDRADADHFAERLLAAETANMRRTSIAGAIEYGMNQIETNHWQGLRQVIDISGDGPNNQGGLVTLSRDKALEAGIIINGLPIMAESGPGSPVGRGGKWPDLDFYYQACVIGGPGSFVIPVNRWDEFAEGVRRKLVLELAGLTWHSLVQNARFTSVEEVDCEIGEITSGAWQSEGYNGGGPNDN